MIFQLLVFITKIALWTRYRIQVHGLDAIRKKKQKGILFLPNHPALIDPVIVSSRLYSDFHPRALVDEKQVRQSPLRLFEKQLRFLQIPDVSVYGRQGVEAVERQLDVCIQALRNGDNILLYPAGHLYRSRYEHLSANSGVKHILEQYPDVSIVLIRTTGLWGSSFGRARGYQPSFGQAIAENIKHLLGNLLFFSPRRQVDITMEWAPESFPRQADKNAINRYLEAFYNENAPENTYVPYFWWEKGGIRTLPEPEQPGTAETNQAIPQDVREKVLAKLREMTPNSEIQDSDLLGQTLGLDSLMVADLQCWIQETFGQQVSNIENLRTVKSVLLAAIGQSDAVQPLRPIPQEWFVPENDTPLKMPEGSKITDLFLTNASRYPDRVLLADQNKGVCSYKKAVLAVMVLKKAIGKIPGDRIGIIMPACLPVTLVYLATLFAGKTPVMVNWTVGLRNMRHCLKNAGVEHILTSVQVIASLEGRGTQFEELKGMFHYLEDLAGAVSTGTKLGCLLASKLSWHSLRAAKVPDTAVILFTSGSENLPKAVPLSHVNLIEDAKSAMKRLDLRMDDCIIAMLPPFHSFGVLINFVMSCGANMRLMFHPNPTEGDMIARMANAYRATVAVGTPTFIAGIFRNADAEQLKTIRIAITGAEKCPSATYELIHSKCPRTAILEGYGITECGPIVSLNPLDGSKPGTLGPAIGILGWTIRDDDLKPVKTGTVGMLYVRGKNVFNGYMNFDGASPFVTLDDGESWYKTGDLVSADEDGFLVFAGRKKRFVKIAGEMVSLPAIETVLQNAWPNQESGPVVAVESTGDEEHPVIALFSTVPVERDEVNRLIRSSGLSPIHSIQKVVNVDEIPILGTGKTDYRKLKTMGQPH